MTHVSQRVRVALCDLMTAVAELNVEVLWPMRDIEGISPSAEQSAFALRDKANELTGAVQSNDRDIKAE